MGFWNCKTQVKINTILMFEEQDYEEIEIQKFRSSIKMQVLVKDVTFQNLLEGQSKTNLEFQYLTHIKYEIRKAQQKLSKLWKSILKLQKVLIQFQINVKRTEIVERVKIT